MAAITQVHVFHGASPGTPSDITDTTIRFKRSDDDAQDANNPVPVPGAGNNFSFRKSFKLRVVTTGPDNKISKLRFFSEGQDLGIDRTIRITTDADYVQGSAADESAEIVGDITTVDVADTFTSTSPLTVAAGQVFGAAETGDGAQVFVVLQGRLGPTAIQGNVDNAMGLVYRFDET